MNLPHKVTRIVGSMVKEYKTTLIAKLFGASCDFRI